jgi:hypothetical protein
MPSIKITLLQKSILRLAQPMCAFQYLHVDFTDVLPQFFLKRFKQDNNVVIGHFKAQI